MNIARLIKPYVSRMKIHDVYSHRIRYNLDGNLLNWITISNAECRQAFWRNHSQDVAATTSVWLMYYQDRLGEEFK